MKKRMRLAIAALCLVVGSVGMVISAQAASHGHNQVAAKKKANGPINWELVLGSDYSVLMDTKKPGVFRLLVPRTTLKQLFVFSDRPYRLVNRLSAVTLARYFRMASKKKITPNGIMVISGHPQVMLVQNMTLTRNEMVFFVKQASKRPLRQISGPIMLTLEGLFPQQQKIINNAKRAHSSRRN